MIGHLIFETIFPICFGSNKILPLKKIKLIGDNASWSIDADCVAVEQTLLRLGYSFRIAESSVARHAYFVDRYGALFNSKLRMLGHRKVALNYYHGQLGTFQKFDRLWERLTERSDVFTVFRVSHSAMQNQFIAAGLGSRVVKIPIEVDHKRFSVASENSRRLSRRALGIPVENLVIGSFQKDGEGWELGLIPKLEKGPDLFAATVRQLQDHYPNLTVLLIGPARGFLIGELEKLGVHVMHFRLNSAEDVARAYHALDAYLVTSRDEGGPKGVLEALASGVPVVTTPVGQSVDFRVDSCALKISENFEPQNLAKLTIETLDLGALSLTDSARKIAERFRIGSQDSQWRVFFDRLFD